MTTKTYNVAWERLEDKVRRECGRLSTISNLTAEQYGEWTAYSKILICMDDFRPLEKKA